MAETPLKAPTLPSSFALQPQPAQQARVTNAVAGALNTIIRPLEQNLQLRANSDVATGYAELKQGLQQEKESALVSGKYDTYRGVATSRVADFEAQMAAKSPYHTLSIENTRSSRNLAISEDISHFETQQARGVELDRMNTVAQARSASIDANPGELDVVLSELEAERASYHGVTGSVEKGDQVHRATRASLISTAIQSQIRSGQDAEPYLQAYGSFLTQQVRDRLKAQSIQKQELLRQERERVELFGAMMEGSQTFVANSKEAQDIIDTTYELDSGAGFGGLEIAAKTSYVPRRFTEALHAGLVAGGEVAKNSASTVRALEGMSPMVARQIPTETKMLSHKFLTMYGLTGDEGRASEFANSLPSLTGEALKVRQHAAAKELNDISAESVTNDLFSGAEPPPSMAASILVGEYREIFNDAYINKGNSAQTSHEIARKLLAEEWGPTQYGGGVGWFTWLLGESATIARRPIEANAGTPPEETNKSWFYDLFVLYASQSNVYSGGVALKNRQDLVPMLQKKGNVYFDWDGENTVKPSYNVLLYNETTQALEVLTDEDGMPIVYNPSHAEYLKAKKNK